MSKITQYSRISHHTIAGLTGGTFSIPSSEDFTDGSWTMYDLALSEIGVNETDGKVYIRIDDDIKEFEFVGGTYSGYGLPDTLQIDNTTDGNDIILTNDDAIISSSTDNKLILDDGGVASFGDDVANNRIYFDGDDGYIETQKSINLTSVLETRILSNNISLEGVISTVEGASQSILRVDSSNKLTIDSDGSSTLLTSTFNIGGNVVIDSGKSILSATGGGQIDLDAYGTPNDVLITTDNGGWSKGGLYLSTTYNELFNYDNDGIISIYTNNSGIILAEDGDGFEGVKRFSLYSNNLSLSEDRTTGLVEFNASAGLIMDITGGGLINIDTLTIDGDNSTTIKSAIIKLAIDNDASLTGFYGEVQIQNNATQSISSGDNNDNRAVIIGSKGSIFNSSVVNSVILGGVGLTASRNDTVYISKPNLPNLSTYVDNAAAITGGLTQSDIYKTSTGELRIVV